MGDVLRCAGNGHRSRADMRGHRSINMRSRRVHVGGKPTLRTHAIFLARLRFDPLTQDRNTTARRIIAEFSVQPDEVASMLEEASRSSRRAVGRDGSELISKSDALHDIAFECTYRAIEFQIQE